jgi:5,6,7,8-tetrahydromethanopterin hydro-lyase
VNPEAEDEEAVYANNRAATTLALGAGRASEPTVGSVLAARAEPANPYFRTS